MANITLTEKRNNSIAHFLTNMGWFDSFVDGLCIANDNEIIEYCNPAFSRIFDFDDIGAAIGKNLMDFMDDDAKEIVKTQTQIRKKNESSKYNLTIKTAKDNIKTLSLSVAPLFNNANQYLGTLAHFIDTTEQNKAEQQLKVSENKYRTLFESSYDAIIVHDFKVNILDVNSQAAKVPNKILQQMTKEVIARLGANGNSGLLKEKPLDAFKRSAVSFDLEVGEEASINYFNISARIINVKEGIIQTIIKDISYQKTTYNALTESEQKLKNVIDNVGIGIALISPNMEILSLNKQMREWNPQIDITQKPICYKAFISPPQNDICEYCPTTLTLKDGLMHESITETPTGEGIKNYRIISTPIKNTKGEVISAIEMVEDITKYKREEIFRKNRSDYLRNLVGKGDAGEIAALTFNYLSSLMPCDAGMLILYNSRDPRSPWQVVYSMDTDDDGNKIIDDKRYPIYPSTGSQLKEVVLEKKMRIIHRDESQYNEAKNNKDGAFGDVNKVSRSLAYFPLLIKNQVVGAITVQSYQANVFNQDRVAILDLVSADLAMAIDVIMHQEATRESEAKRLMAMKIAKLGYWEYNVADDLFTFDDQVYSLYNTSAEKIGGYKISPAQVAELFFHPDDAHLVANEMKKALETTDPNFSCQFEYRTPSSDNDFKFMSVRYFILKDDQGSTIKVYGIIRDITERKLAEEKLLELKNAVEQSVDGIALASLEGHIRFVNKTWARMHGYSGDELIGEHLSIFHTKQQLETEVNPLNKRLLETGSAEGEIGHVRRDGTTFPTRMVSTLLIGADQKPYGMLAIARDITEHKRAEETLRNSEEKLNAMADAALDAIIVIDNEGKIAFWNNAAIKIFGYSKGEIMGKDPHVLLAPQRYYNDYLAGFSKFQKTGLGNARGKTLQLAAVHKDGHEFPVEISLSSMKVKDQWQAVGIVRDITEQFRVRENQARIVAQYTAMIDTVPAQIYIKDKDLKYVEVNDAFCELTEKTKDEIIGKTVFDVFPKEIAELHNALDLSAINEKKEIVNHEKQMVNSSGETVYVSITKIPLMGANGEITGLVGMIQDITEYHKSRDQLIQSDKLAAIGTLAAGVAHEINNPIGYINSNLNTMNKYLAKINQYTESIKNTDAAKWNDLQEMLKDFIDAVNESIEGANRVKKIVVDLKSFSRIDRAEKEMANLNEGIESTLNIVWNEIKYTCKVEKDYGDLPDLYCIPNQLNQVFLNLLVNAGQSIAGKSGLIKIKTWADEQNIYASIEDNGCGIPEKNLKRIFEPFFTTKEVGKGTGLGLSLVYDIIQKHKGHISISSEIGVGTKFAITLPREGVKDND